MSQDLQPGPKQACVLSARSVYFLLVPNVRRIVAVTETFARRLILIGEEA